MSSSLTLDGLTRKNILSFISGLGMMVASFMTIDHFFAANYPVSIWEGSFCDISAFFNCDSSAFSAISAIFGVPIGYFGMMLGGLIALGSVFPSRSLERTNGTLALLNIIGVIVLLAYSVVILGSLCLLCTGYYLFSGLSFYLFWRHGIAREEAGQIRRHLKPSLTILATFGMVTLVGAYGVSRYHHARIEAQSGGVVSRIVNQYYDLPLIENPSFISPYWSVRSTEQFEDAPIRIIEYADLLCPDCLFLAEQLDRLKVEFEGKINVAFQFFPLEAECNTVVEKDLHPGACDITLIAARDPSKFVEIHDEIWANFRSARNPDWQQALAEKYGVEDALTDPATQDIVHRIIETGREYEKTHERYSHGIRSTPTMIINNRMIIGTLPYEQLRAIFQALVDEAEQGGPKQFIENWEERGR
ncbi:vitamin K epoxide reductase family protein [Gemmatimonadota bacterium]